MRAALLRALAALEPHGHAAVNVSCAIAAVFVAALLIAEHLPH